MISSEQLTALCGTITMLIGGECLAVHHRFFVVLHWYSRFGPDLQFELIFTREMDLRTACLQVENKMHDAVKQIVRAARA